MDIQHSALCGVNGMKKHNIMQQIRQLKSQPSIAVPRAQSITPPVSPQKLKKSCITSPLQAPSLPINPKLLHPLTFCFPITDIQLSPKRTKIISVRIEEHGGTVISFNGQKIDQSIDYLLVSSRVCVPQLKSRMSGMVNYGSIVLYEFVMESMREEAVQDVKPYLLHKNTQEKEETEEETITITRAVPRKMSKQESVVSQGQTFGIKENHNELTDAQDSDDETVDLRQRDNNKAQTMSVLSTEPSVLIKAQTFPYVDKTKFLCQKTPGDQQIFSMNKFVCDELMKLQKIYEGEKDLGRKIAYLKAVSAIKTLDRELEQEDDIESVRGIGTKIAKKIKELIRTGRLQKLERLQQSHIQIAQNQLCRVWGIGPAKAQQLIQEGVFSIDDLRKRQQLLNKNQKIGLKYLQDFERRIPRDKVQRMGEVMRHVFSDMVDSVRNYHFEICGSYRRGKATCGDIDLIITRRDGEYERRLLLDFVMKLEQTGFLVNHLQFPSGSETKSSLSYMGVCRFEDQTHHRIDIKYYPLHEYPYALLYFTGSDMFNRSMRLYAKRKGIHLSDHGATARNQLQSQVHIPTCLSQSDIFEFLELDYRAPNQRQV